ncbi:hypothetical protein [Arthrobacter sp. YN]|uniref:hypothetical protein n=1 Tax=Arthrobacter sp. YN TaxID=2020486 RepID=UPI000B60B76E|nr:hypothetical protein [Arthrobacter sp. YN]ASN20664.1 hypothetical protein CGK93_13990 [Arthrobacter sp. YN]
MSLTPYDLECTCLDDELFMCRECGEIGEEIGGCPACYGTIELVPDDTRMEDYPATDCPQHGGSDDE